MKLRGRGHRWHTAILLTLAALLFTTFCELSGPTLGAEPGTGTGLDATLDLDIGGAQAIDALRVVARLGGFSLVADPGLKGNITAELKGLTLRDALDVLSYYYGWGWKLVGKTIVVGDADKLTGTFGPSLVQSFPLHYAKTSDMVAKLSLVISQDRIRVDERTNTVVVKGSSEELERVRSVIQSVDIPLRQVALISKVVEISANASRNLGIDWSFKGLNFDFQAGRLSVGLDYDSTLKALEDSGQASTLAKPGVTTLDGTEASILLGERYPISVEEKSSDGKVTKSMQFVDVGVKLKILPRVNTDGLVTVELTPEISSITSITPEGYPQVSSRQTHTVVTVADGQTIAIGGLFQKQKIESIRKTPGLGNLPLLGNLFTSKRVETKDSEVVVFVTIKLLDTGLASPVSQLSEPLPMSAGTAPPINAVVINGASQKTKTDEASTVLTPLVLDPATK